MAAPRYVLAIDQGSSSSRALVVDADGRVAGEAHEALVSHYPQPGWVEQDPEAIWSSTQEVIGRALRAARAWPNQVAAIGIANQRETALLWDRGSGQPLGPAISWQDRRTAGQCEALRREGHEAAIQLATGLPLDPYFTATKLAWCVDSQPELRERAESGMLLAGTVDSWLIWKLSGGRRHLSDFTNASRTQLFNINRGRWDEQLCERFGVPRATLPATQPSRSAFATTSDDVLGAEVPILGVAGDQQAALVGQGCLTVGEAKCTYGTGSFLLVNAGRRPLSTGRGMLTSIGAAAGQSGPEYVVEGSVFTAGALLDWLASLGMAANAAELQALAESVPDSAGVTIVPALSGLGAPYWSPEARGAITGLTRGAGAAHFARASLEAIALSTAELVGVLDESLPNRIAELRIDGGVARSDLFAQLQADLLGIPVHRPENLEATAMGVAYLAGVGAGIWSNLEEAVATREPGRTFDPAMPDDERQERLAAWRLAVERALP